MCRFDFFFFSFILKARFIYWLFCVSGLWQERRILMDLMSCSVLPVVNYHPLKCIRTWRFLLFKGTICKIPVMPLEFCEVSNTVPSWTQSFNFLSVMELFLLPCWHLVVTNGPAAFPNRNHTIRLKNRWNSSRKYTSNKFQSATRHLTGQCSITEAEIDPEHSNVWVLSVSS